MNHSLSEVKNVIQNHAITRDIPSYTLWCDGIHPSSKTDFITFIDKLREIKGLSDYDLIENFDTCFKEVLGTDQLTHEENALCMKVVSTLVYANRTNYMPAQYINNNSSNPQ